MLTAAFPHAVEANGNIYVLNTDFRVCLKIVEAFEDPRLTFFEKQAIMCGLLFKDMPENFSDACKAAVKFLDCGKPKSEEGKERVYSFTKDETFIYSAFLQTYGVDLKESSMHWWKFVAMFYDLNPETTFERIVDMRNRKNQGKLTKEEVSLWYQMSDILDLNEEELDPELEEARARFDALMGGG